MNLLPTLLLLRPSFSSGGRSLEDTKCSACVAILDELASSVAREPPQMNVDMRLMSERLADQGGGDSSGKVRSYETSELRAIERLESMCPPMKNYVMIEEEERSYYQRAFGIGDGEGMSFGGSITLNTPQSKDQGSSLRVYCDSLVEAHEDEFTEALRAGMDRLDERICVEILGVCADAEEMSTLPRVAKRVEQMTLEPPDEATPEDIQRAKSLGKKKRRKRRKSSSSSSAEPKSEL